MFNGEDKLKHLVPLVAHTGHPHRRCRRSFATYRLLNLYEEAQLARTDPRDGQAGMYIIASLFFGFAAFLLLLIVVPYCLMRYAARQAKET